MSINAYPAINHRDSYPFIGSSSTTINPVFKYSQTNGSTFPTSEFDPRTFQDVIFNKTRTFSELPYKGLPYSTQSLDRRKLAAMRSTGSIKEEIILRPLQQIPFEYLHRPGSYLDVRDHKQDYYASQTLPRDFFEKNSSTHSIRDVAL